MYELYADSSFVAPLVYASMGSSRDLAIGPVAVVSLLLGSLLTEEIKDFKSHDYLRLTFTATFFAGITQMTLGVLRYSLVSICNPNTFFFLFLRASGIWHSLSTD